MHSTKPMLHTMLVFVLVVLLRTTSKHTTNGVQAMEITNFVPAEGAIISAATSVVGAEIVVPPGADQGIRSVRFQTRSPTGQRSAFVDGMTIVDPTNTTEGPTPIGSYYSSRGPVAMNSAGTWHWRVEVEDTSRNRIQSAWITLHTSNAGHHEAFLHTMIRQELRDLIRVRGGGGDDDDAMDMDLRPKLLRLGFHDCVGGCDGCIDLHNMDNTGLELPIAALTPIVEKYKSHGISRADIWALATLTAADEAESQNNLGTFPMKYFGRIDCENTGTACYDKDKNTVPCSATRGDHRELPGNDLDTHQLLLFFSTNFQFTPREVVAVMGAHTIGTLSRTNSGFDGPRGWVNNNRQLDNAYYAQLVGGDTPTTNENELRHAPNWNVQYIDNSNLPPVQTEDRRSVVIPSRYQWERGGGGGGPPPGNGPPPQGNGGNTRGLQGNNDPPPPPPPQGGNIIMLNSDIALVRDLSSDNGDNNQQYIDSVTGEVDGCDFRCRGNNNNVELLGCGSQRNPPACPLARMTLAIAAEYKFDNTLWVHDFESVLIKMVNNGYKYDDNNTNNCQSESPCILSPSDTGTIPEIESTAPPSNTPTKSPTLKPTKSPTLEPTPKSTAAPIPSTLSPTKKPSCPKNSKKVVYVNKKGKKKKCSWVKTGKTLQIRRKRCNSNMYSYLGKKIKENCPKACGKYAGKGICKNLFLDEYK